MSILLVAFSMIPEFRRGKTFSKRFDNSNNFLVIPFFCSFVNSFFCSFTELCYARFSIFSVHWRIQPTFVSDSFRFFVGEIFTLTSESIVFLLLDIIFVFQTTPGFNGFKKSLFCAKPDMQHLISILEVFHRTATENSEGSLLRR